MKIRYKKHMLTRPAGWDINGGDIGQPMAGN